MGDFKLSLPYNNVLIVKGVMCAIESGRVTRELFYRVHTEKEWNSSAFYVCRFSDLTSGHIQIDQSILFTDGHFLSFTYKFVM